MTDEGIHAGFVDSLNACRNFILFSSCSPSRSIFSSAKYKIDDNGIMKLVSIPATSGSEERNKKEKKSFD